MEEKNINNTGNENSATEHEFLDKKTQQELEAKSQEIVKKLDKESATRKFTGKMAKFFYIVTRKFTGKMAKFFYIVCLLVSGYHLYTAAFGPPVTLVHRSLHVAMITAMGFLMYPCFKSSDHSKPSIIDWILALLCFTVPAYIWHDYLGVVERAGNPNQTDLIMATLLVVLVLECSRWNGPATPTRPT